MKTKFYLLVLVTFTIFSCQTIKTGTAKTIDVNGIGVIHLPVVANLDIKEQKVTKTATIRSTTSSTSAENEIVRELLKENNADILVEPKFYSVSKNGKTELTVTGWLAYYKNFRSIEEKDIKLLEVNPSHTSKPETTLPIILGKK